MSNQWIPMKRWNLFARELEDILATHNLGIAHLDDLVGIHQEKVRRLKQSLLIPKSFPILNIDEMDQLTHVCNLSDSEVTRLHAAILAASIEKTLMDRINQDDALLAAEQIFPVILKAMEERMGDTEGLSTMRGRETELGEDIDSALELALDAIDDATMALHLSRNAVSYPEHVENVQKACDSFTVALAELDEVEDSIRAMQVWHCWYAEARKGLVAARERLEELDEHI